MTRSSQVTRARSSWVGTPRGTDNRRGRRAFGVVLCLLDLVAKGPGCLQPPFGRSGTDKRGVFTEVVVDSWTPVHSTTDRWTLPKRGVESFGLGKDVG